MIWHIVRKDLRLVWPIIAATAAVNWLNAALLLLGGPFARVPSVLAGGSALALISHVALPALGLAGLALLVSRVVHEDPLPGTTQDWLTRPIPRAQLLIAKLITVKLGGLAPILVADLVMGFAAGLPAQDVVLASLTRSLALLGLICLPVAMLSFVTRNLTSLLVLGLVAVLLLAALGAGWSIMGLPAADAINSGYGWVPTWMLLVVNLALCPLLLAAQLHWRGSYRPVVTLLVGAVAVMAAGSIPLSAAYRVQQAVTADQVLTQRVAQDMTRPLAIPQIPSRSPGTTHADRTVVITVPLAVSGAAADTRLFVDQGYVRVTGPDGYVFFNGAVTLWNTYTMQSGLVLPSIESGGRLPVIFLPIPATALVAARGAHATVEVTLTLTELRVTLSKPLPVLEDGFLDSHTRCHVRIGPDDTRQVICESAREISSCYAIRGAGKPQGQVNTCRAGDYTPWSLPVWRDAFFSTTFNELRSYGRPLKDDPDRRSEVIEMLTPVAHGRQTLSFPLDAVVEQPRHDGNSLVDGVGARARFPSASAGVRDHQGNLYVVDAQGTVIRRVTPGGVVSTLAGQAGDAASSDGTGKQARFSQINALAIMQMTCCTRPSGPPARSAG